MSRERLLGQTPWQTVGPFFHYALPYPGGGDLVSASDAGARPDLVPAEHFMLKAPRRQECPDGEVVEIEGRVLDGARAPLPDALIEIWQADGAGGYGGEFGHFGRCATRDDGAFSFRTLLPGRVAGPGNSLQAAHIAVGVLGRGILSRLVTRIYFEDQPGLDDDGVLALVPAARRKTLIARRSGSGRYSFDIVLQGRDETVFFDC